MDSRLSRRLIKIGEISLYLFNQLVEWVLVLVILAAFVLAIVGMSMAILNILGVI